MLPSSRRVVVERTRKLVRVVALGLLLLLAVYSFARFGRYRGLGAQVIRPGTEVQAFTLKGLDGKPFALGASGRPALLVFWGASCPSCKVELPGLQRVAEAWQGKVDVVTISDDDPQALALAASKLRLTLPVLVDGDGSVSRSLDVYTIPYNVLVGADRKVITDFVGPPGEARMKDWFDEVTRSM
jgi:peroxiredoxin